MTKIKLRLFCVVGTSLVLAVFANSSAFAQSEQNAFQYDDGVSHGSWLYVTDDSFDEFNQTDPGPGMKPVVYNEFNYSRRTKIGEIHLANASRDDDNLNQVGITFKRLRFDGFSGHGKSIAKIRNPYSSADPYLFHGGNNLRYGYNGFILSRNISLSIKLNYAQAKITAPQLQERTVRSMGVSTKNIKLTIMEVQRGDDKVGSVLSLSTVYRGHQLELDYLKQANGASYQALNYSRFHKGVNYRVGIRHTKNPLFSVKNENRIVFSMDFKFGKRISRFSATENGEADESDQEQKKTRQNKILIAGGLIGAGLAISSGSSGSDSSPRVESQTEAARIVLNQINPVSVTQNREFGGYVFINADGSFGSTTPIRGEAASVALPAPGSITPPGSQATAIYHTHGAFDPRFDNENFSPTDIASDNFLGLDGYLGTPGGAFKFHQTGTVVTVTLGTIAVQ